MFELILKVWYFIAILPFFIFQEGNELLVNFLKKRDIYWDAWYSLLLALLLLLTILLMAGYTYQ